MADLHAQELNDSVHILSTARSTEPVYKTMCATGGRPAKPKKQGK